MKVEAGQEAAARLRFVDGRSTIPRIWSCRVQVMMPLRTARYGRISPEEAAEITATVATKASRQVMHRRSEWMPVAFCIEFGKEMTKVFQKDFQGLGAQASGR